VKLDTLLKIFFGGVQQIERRKQINENEMFHRVHFMDNRFDKCRLGARISGAAHPGGKHKNRYGKESGNPFCRYGG
jgi:hypothetical protein